MAQPGLRTGWELGPGLWVHFASSSYLGSRLFRSVALAELRQTPRRKMLSPPQAQIVRDVSKRWNKSFIAGKAKTKLDLHKRWNKLYIKTKSKMIHYRKQADALDLKVRKLMKKVDGINKWLLDHGKTITKARKALAARGYVLRRPKCRK